MAAMVDERTAQKSYWMEHSSEPTVEAMMLDSKAAEIDQLERPEVLSTLGCVAGKRVLELGAGIGRFTGELARAAKSVMACDFMDVSIAENKRQHEKLGNVSFMVADVTELQQDAGSYDVVFSNWLLMYLSDEEVKALATKVLRWLSPGGVLFFRESCFRPSGDKPRKGNPTHYRNPRDYFAMFDGAELLSADGSSSTHLQLVCCKCVDTYVTVKKNQNQICWKFTKVETPHPRPPLYRTFLDTHQYSDRGIALYERVYGRGFVSPGGAAKSSELLEALQLQPGMRVLDVGCGIGGNAFMAADTYGCHVHGIDLSVNMILVAIERAAAAIASSRRRSGSGRAGAAAAAAGNNGLCDGHAAGNGNVKGTAGALANGTANGMANGAAHGMPNGTANGTAHSMANGTANGTAQSMVNGTAHGLANGTAHSMANGTANSTANGTAHSLANGMANGAAHGVANGTAHSKANGTANGIANGSAEGTAKGGSSPTSPRQLQQAPHDVTFEVADVLTRDFPPGTFDVCVSRDALLHVQGKQELFGRLFRWLKPGGRLMVTDYCKPDGTDLSPGFASYIQKRRYSPLSISDYGQQLEAAGFTDVVALDCTPELISTLETELQRLQEDRAGFEAFFSAAEFADVVERWQGKLSRAKAGEQLWGHVTACKPVQ